ncbi:hypothetical protein, unlikely [Trypanosoma brucei gambiense DAL972]|uniref:Uncharacterized protein n=1 Tax=Trypanosoma brucei gambiense (strain MHOM/CI/86/DAL972) TaxID=679716 RepID=D0A3Z8_TRYB9|nr:hypothetical protein, unlikely [Trypanosoma brucei gambiense DAL972]CBH15992.1 hypothetical protein, unlikely [Trypanosoma brucei gambiense DAL972]|eukprot:XP_011778256.1 hypothetical protein, unlikely [Trypanosoma brucei gambiense DAL972]
MHFSLFPSKHSTMQTYCYFSVFPFHFIVSCKPRCFCFCFVLFCFVFFSFLLLSFVGRMISVPSSPTLLIFRILFFFFFSLSSFDCSHGSYLYILRIAVQMNIEG